MAPRSFFLTFFPEAANFATAPAGSWRLVDFVLAAADHSETAHDGDAIRVGNLPVARNS